jgi:hypothetical protein
MIGEIPIPVVIFAVFIIPAVVEVILLARLHTLTARPSPEGEGILRAPRRLKSTRLGARSSASSLRRQR